MTRYGFYLNNRQTLDLDADTLAEGIAAAEKATGARVLLGRSLDGYDPDTGDRADLASRNYVHDRQQQLGAEALPDSESWGT